MATLLSFHAHPDDESIGTGGVIAKAAAEGHRVVIVTATRGEHGEVPEHIEGPGKPLADLRVQELTLAAETLGAARLEFLDYEDSGMAGDELNNRPECFWQANVDEAAARLVKILEEEKPDVMTYYDENGVYGHPDHVQVHRVGKLAAETARVPHVFMSTANTERSTQLFSELKESGFPFPGGLDDRPRNFGVPAERITTTVDVSGVFDIKQAAMKHHASQIFENSFFIGLPDELLRRMWGTEFFVKVGAPAGYKSDDLLADL